MLDLNQLPGLWSDWRARYADRASRYIQIDRVVRGDFDVFDADEQSLLAASPNFVETALSDTAEAASMIPTIRCTPHLPSDLQRNRASAMEFIATSYLTSWNVELLIPNSVRMLAMYGLCPWIVWPDFEQKVPILEVRDPRTCFPEPGYHSGDAVRRCMFTRDVYLSQLPAKYLELIASWYVHKNQRSVGRVANNTKIVLVEWFDEDEYVLAALMSSSGATGTAAGVTTLVQYTPVELERIPNKLNGVPVVLGSRITDSEFRGQFDQVLDLQRAHVRLAGLALDYADQSVYSDVWVKDLVGEMSFGGGSFIELGPQGAIGRVPPAVTAMNVQRDLKQLEDGLHLGSRWPSSRPGEISQSIASAKFLESAAGMMNTAIRTYHLTLGNMFETALQTAMEIDRKFFPGKKTVTGILRNQQFLNEYDTKDIEPKNRIRAEYGIGLGRTSSESAVLAIQYAQNGLISQELVQESIEGVTDLARERSRIDTEKLTGILVSKMLQDAQSGVLDDGALVKMIQRRQKGEDMIMLYEELVVKAKANQMASPMAGPGALGPQPGTPLGQQAPQGPPGAPPTPPVPPAPAPSQMMMSMRAGDRATGQIIAHTPGPVSG